MKWLAGLALGSALVTAASAQQGDAPAYTPDGKMVFPKDYRSWVYLSTGFDMSYVDVPPGTHIFDTVFVNRAAYDAFLKSGAWPDGTVLVLEHRGAGNDPSFVKQGQFQSGPALNVEAHVKDRGGWAFYAWGKDGAPAAVIPKTANCYSCHAEHGATETTFTQFYPILVKSER